MSSSGASQAKTLNKENSLEARNFCYSFLNGNEYKIITVPVKRTFAGLASKAGLVVGLVLAEHLFSMEHPTQENTFN
jgi:hypothetical protein